MRTYKGSWWAGMTGVACGILALMTAFVLWQGNARRVEQSWYLWPVLVLSLGGLFSAALYRFEASLDFKAQEIVWIHGFRPFVKRTIIPFFAVESVLFSVSTSSSSSNWHLSLKIQGFARPLMLDTADRKTRDALFDQARRLATDLGKPLTNRTSVGADSSLPLGSG